MAAGLSSFIALLNKNNSSLAIVFSTNNVTLGLPQATQDAVVNGKPVNTQVLLSAISKMGFSGQALISYKRVDLSELGTPTVSSLDAIEDIPTLLSVINEGLGTTLTTEDVAALTFQPTGYLTNQGVTLTALDDHYVIKGTTTITITTWLPEVQINALHQLLHVTMPAAGPYF